MFNIILIFFCVQLFFAIYLWIRQSKTKSYTPLNSAQKTTVIIPFRNEEKRILPLIESINQAAIQFKDSDLMSHFQFIFIDDHSTDKSCNVILNQLDISFDLIRLRQTKGKKFAIKRGVEKAKFNRLLTLDADITFSTNYLDLISKTPCESLTILGVNMDTKTFINRLYAVEFWFLQRLTFGIQGVLCNGANLLFTKKAFEASLKIRTDFNQLSGDDIYLLKAIKQLNLPILNISAKQLMVNTNPPDNFSQLIQQRKRWVTKMKDVPSFLGGLFILTSNAMFILSIYLCLTLNWLYLIPIIIKISSEFLSVDGIKKQLMVLPHQFYYPFYLLVLLLNLPFSKKESKWV